MLKCPDFPKSLKKLALLEDVSKSTFYTVILDEKGKQSMKTSQFDPNFDS